MLEGNLRRDKILKILEKENKPIKGTVLAETFGVSRQVIVQDIALIRANNKNILSTNKGYVLYNDIRHRHSRLFAVRHTDEQMQDELMTMVTYGGTVRDVIIEHDVYGQITADLLLENKNDVEEFIDKINNSKSKPLKVLASDIHLHTVEAASDELLDIIEEKLRGKGYLI